jgi:hypothetical protein
MHSVNSATHSGAQFSITECFSEKNHVYSLIQEHIKYSRRIHKIFSTLVLAVCGLFVPSVVREVESIPC